MEYTGKPYFSCTSRVAAFSVCPRSRRSTMTKAAATFTPGRVLRSSMLSRMAVPAVITSSMMTTSSPALGRYPTREPPSPWSLASFRLKNQGRSRPRRARAEAALTARGMPL